MPLNSYNYGIKRSSLTDHLSNKNVLDEQPIKRIDPLRKLRGSLMALRSRPEESTFGPDEERFPNQPPLTPAIGPIREELVPSTEFGPVREIPTGVRREPIVPTPAVTPTPETVPTTPSVTTPPREPGMMPGRPEFPGPMAAVTMPAEERIGPRPPTTPAMDYWAQPALGKMPLDQFVALAGSLASAIAPRTPQGRAGTALAQTAGPMYRERIKREYEAPEKELGMAIRREELKKLRAPKVPEKPKEQRLLEWYETLTPERKALADEIAMKKPEKMTKEEELKWYMGLSPEEQLAADKYWGKARPAKAIKTWMDPKNPDKIVNIETGEKPPKGYVPYSTELVKGPVEKLPSPVTWTTATKELKGRFGKVDPVGNIIITPELHHAHRIAQRKLVELKETGVKPLKAVYQAEDFARNIERRFFEYIDAAKGRKHYIKQVEKEFKQKYGYIPKMRR